MWVNVTIPATSNGAIEVMLPKSIQSDATCAWECGAMAATATVFTTEWVAFDAAGNGHEKYHAVPPPQSASVATPPPAYLSEKCTPVWHKGPVQASTAGIDGPAKWTNAQPGYTMFPSLSLDATSGDYAFYAVSC